MEPDCSVPHLQPLVTCPYPESVGPCHNYIVLSQVVDGVAASRYGR